MILTKKSLHEIIKEEVISSIVILEAKEATRINENFMMNMAKKFGISKNVIAAIIAAAVSAGEIPAYACDDPPSTWDCPAKDYGAPCDQVSRDYTGGITHNMVLKAQGGKYAAEIVNNFTKDKIVVTGSSLEDLESNIKNSDDVRNWMKIKVVGKLVNGKKEKMDVNIGNPYKVDLSRLN